MDPLAVAFVLGMVALPVAGVAWSTRWQGRKFETFRRRHGDPQAGSATGTGVERGPLHDVVADLAALPRSPMAPVDAVFPRRAASTGLQRRRVSFHG